MTTIETPSPREIEITPLPAFVDVGQVRRTSAEVLLPPSRMTVTEAAEKYRVIHNPGGGYSGPYKSTVTPYFREVQNALTDRRYRGVVLVGPAQSGKTDALLNWILHGVTCDPADMLLIEKSERDARDFSKRRIDRMVRHAERMQDRLVDDAILDKQFRGMLLSLGAPTINALSGKPIPRVALTDYDRMPDDIDGEGAPFDLASARPRTFGSQGMVFAESSPGRPVLTSDWKPKTAHEAPPTIGILALYNRGDRRRLVWPCPHCGGYFEGGFDALRWDDDITDPAAAAKTVYMLCQVKGCGGVIDFTDRRGMLAAAIWIADGQSVDDEGNVIGSRPLSSIASFWLRGTAAAFSTWADLVEKYLVAKRHFDATGDETALKTTVNVDQGEPYLPAAARFEQSIDVEELEARALREIYPLGRVPAPVRFLTAAVDVQANRFEVLVRGWGPEGETWIVDRFTIFKALETDGRERLVAPAQRQDDWNLLFDEVLDRTYPRDVDDGAAETRIRVARLMVDSGGMAGVTDRAYAFYKEARRRRVARRILIGKGTGALSAPRVMTRFPEAKRKDRKARARGEIPVTFFQTDLMKDALEASLQVEDAGPLYLHLSYQLLDEAPPHSVLEELTAERRGADGRWRKTKPRNEMIDLLTMSHAAAIELGLEKVDWSKPRAKSIAIDDETNPFWIVAAAEESDEKEDPATPMQGARPSQPGRPLRRGSSFVNGWRS